MGFKSYSTEEGKNNRFLYHTFECHSFRWLVDPIPFPKPLFLQLEWPKIHDDEFSVFKSIFFFFTFTLFCVVRKTWKDFGGDGAKPAERSTFIYIQKCSATLIFFAVAFVGGQFRVLFAEVVRLFYALCFISNFRVRPRFC